MWHHGKHPVQFRANSRLCLSPLQTYLKEIMREIGTYNSKGAHKSTWELKPEYRHYQSAEEEEERKSS